MRLPANRLKHDPGLGVVVRVPLMNGALDGIAFGADVRGRRDQDVQDYRFHGLLSHTGTFPVAFWSMLSPLSSRNSIRL
jgi:hypothetical protein